MQSSGNLVPGISAIFVNKEGFWMELFSNICRQCGLGEPVSQPFPLNGGFLHKMYGLTTDQGTFALKLLNPMVRRKICPGRGNPAAALCRNGEGSGADTSGQQKGQRR